LESPVKKIRIEPEFDAGLGREIFARSTVPGSAEPGNAQQTNLQEQ
jgi:hypothetical protein